MLYGKCREKLSTYDSRPLRRGVDYLKRVHTGVFMSHMKTIKT